MRPVLPTLLVAFLLAGCLATGEPPEGNEREIRVVDVEFDQHTVLHSSVLRFRFLATAQREASFGTVRFSGSIGEGRELDEEFVVPVDRVGDKGDLVVELRVADGLWEHVDPDPDRTLSGRIDLTLEDGIGVFATGTVDGLALRFHREYAPEVSPVPSGRDVYPNELLELEGEGFLRPEEGTTWAVVDSGTVTLQGGASRPVTNARVPIRWDGSREEALLPVSPAIFGVRIGEFDGDIRFENELATGEVFEGTAQPGFTATLRAPRIDEISPEEGSRGEKITVTGRGFLAEDDETNSGTYFELQGELAPSNPEIPRIEIGDPPLVVTPFRVLDEKTVEQDVSYSVDPVTRQLDGLGAVPGVFQGTITPFVYRGNDVQEGEAWTGVFTVLPPKQVVRVKFLPGFSRALDQYGLSNVETEIRDRIMTVLKRDYAETAVDFRTEEPDDFIEYTTIEIGGPDPSGLLNFGYDNSFNDGGKDVGNLYLSDYLGGVNRHSQDAGYLPFGGVFIESFIAFSPTLFPDNFGTSVEFDRVLAAFMPGLGGTPVAATEWPDGPRSAAIRDAINLLGNLTGHTASHEVGHALGLAHFPATVEDYTERYHNDPPGPNLIMDAGSDRPFNERAELNGEGPAEFSAENLRYLQAVLPPR
jgi:hypothetical protein